VTQANQVEAQLKEIKFVHFNKNKINKKVKHTHTKNGRTKERRMLERANVITRLIDGLQLCKPFVKTQEPKSDSDRDMTALWSKGMPSTVLSLFICNQIK